MMEYAKNAIINPLLPSPRINSYNYIGIFDFYLETVKNHIEWNSPPLPFLFLLPYTPPIRNHCHEFRVQSYSPFLYFYTNYNE